MTENLWRNPSFEDGWTHEPYNIPEIQIPLEHELEFDEGLPNPDDPDDHPLQQPEVNCKNRDQIPDEEEDEFPFFGFWTLKIFKGWGAIRVRLSQTLNLEAGDHTMVLPIYPDLVIGYDDDDQKIGAPDPKSGQVRIIVDGSPSAWQYMGGEARVLLQTNYVFDFALTTPGETKITVEFYLPHPLRQNGVFTDGWSLTHLGSVCPDCRGGPRVQYKRTYVLLPQGCNLEWKYRAIDGSYGKEYTIGSSADDAGIGDLDYRRVIAVNPHLIGDGLDAEWFETHYPGVEYESITTDDPDALAIRLANDDFDKENGNGPDPDVNPSCKHFLPTLHLQTEQDGWLDYLEICCERGVPPYAIKFVSGYESAKKVKQVAAAYGVDILTIGRHYDPNQGKWLNAADKKAAVRDYVGRFKDAIDQNPIDIVSDLNETIATDNIESIANAVAFSVEFVPYVRELWGGSVGSVALETAVGNPREGQQTQMLRPVAYEVVKASDDAQIPSFIGYHSYWWGRIHPSLLRKAGVIAWPGRTLYSAQARPKIVLPNALAAMKLTGDTKLAGLFIRKAVEDFIGREGLTAQSLAYESGLEADWKWHAGRSLEIWRPEFNAVGLDPLHLFTEIGVVSSPDGGPTLLATEGWRSAACYNADWDFYKGDLFRWQDLVRLTSVGTAGTIFTVGADFTGWRKFKLKKPQMVDLAMGAWLP